MLAGLKVNRERGDALRDELERLTRRTLDGLERLDVHTPNRSGLPIIEIPLRHHEQIDSVGRFLFEKGVYVTLAAYPLVPKDEVGFRVQLTSPTPTPRSTRCWPRWRSWRRRGVLRPAGELPTTTEERRMTTQQGDVLRRWAWAGFLAVGAVLALLYMTVPPLKGSSYVMFALGLSPIVGILGGPAAAPARVQGAVAVVRRRLPAVLARRPLHLQLPEDHRPRDDAVPVGRRRVLRRGLPGVDGGVAAARPPALGALDGQRRAPTP